MQVKNTWFKNICPRCITFPLRAHNAYRPDPRLRIWYYAANRGMQRAHGASNGSIVVRKTISKSKKGAWRMVEVFAKTNNFNASTTILKFVF